MPAESDPPSLPPKFPLKHPAGPILALPRRTAGGTRPPLELSEASAEARRTIKAIVSVTRPSGGEATTIDPKQASELEASLRMVEARLEERERAVEALEATLADRERDLAELEALSVAREKVLVAAQRAAADNRHPRAPISVAEKAALEALKAEVDRQEIALREQKAALAERERFVNETEAKLFEKMMQQQEQETEIEQKLEEIGSREKRLRAREAVPDPQAVAKAAEPARKFDEFNE
jgi:DNA repair exonuclease SbcCD ATPase subunit